jgi:DNA polymerase
VPDEVVEGAEVFVLGQNPGEEEEREGRPFVGSTGRKMMAVYFPVAGLVRGENVSIGNTLRCRWQNSNNLPTGKILDQAMAHCTRAYLRIPESTKLVVAQGALAVRAMSKDPLVTVEKWRGFLIPNNLNKRIDVS